MMYLLHIVLTHTPFAFKVLAIFLILATNFLTVAVGSIRWWCMSHARLPELWAAQRKSYQREIRDRDRTIAELRTLLSNYQQLAFFGAVEDSRKAADG